MKRLVLVWTLMAVASGVALAQAQTRHLVYSFTLGVQSDSHSTVPMIQYVQESPAPGPKGGETGIIPAPGGYPSLSSGNKDDVGVASDAGTITVNVLGIQPDGGLSVNVGEAGQKYRKAAPTDCLVYPTTKITCAGPILPEEAAVIMTLSPSFFDPSHLDNKNHWQEDGGIPGLALDFTASGPSGSVVTIAESKTQKVGDGLGGTTHGSATFTYDTVRRVPTALKSYDIERPAEGQPGQYSNIVYDITATLVTDSGTTAKN